MDEMIKLYHLIYRNEELARERNLAILRRKARKLKKRPTRSDKIIPLSIAWRVLRY